MYALKHPVCVAASVADVLCVMPKKLPLLHRYLRGTLTLHVTGVSVLILPPQSCWSWAGRSFYQMRVSHAQEAPPRTRNKGAARAAAEVPKPPATGLPVNTAVGRGPDSGPGQPFSVAEIFIRKFGISGSIQTGRRADGRKNQTLRRVVSPHREGNLSVRGDFSYFKALGVSALLCKV